MFLKLCRVHTLVVFYVWNKYNLRLEWNYCCIVEICCCCCHGHRRWFINCNSHIKTVENLKTTNTFKTRLRACRHSWLIPIYVVLGGINKWGVGEPTISHSPFIYLFIFSTCTPNRFSTRTKLCEGSMGTLTASQSPDCLLSVQSLKMTMCGPYWFEPS